MKNFDYYSKPHATYPNLRDIKAKLRELINETPMTADQRDVAMGNLCDEGREEFNKQAMPYNVELAKLDAEFWDDAREDIGYDDFLTDKGVLMIQSEAYDRGHSRGFSCVFGELSKLACFAENIIKESKKSLVIPKRWSTV